MAQGNEPIKSKRNLAKLIRECESAKKTLNSGAIAVDITVDTGDEDLDMTFDKKLFNKINKKHFDKIVPLITDALKNSKVTKNQIEHVVMVGGSTRIEEIRRILTDYFAPLKLDYGTVDPDTAIAQGAAMIAAKGSPATKGQLADINTVDCVA